jgi:predicted ribosomally synthesized peptide with nif11-like leader
MGARQLVQGRREPSKKTQPQKGIDMSVQNIDAFYKQVLKNPELAKGIADAADRDIFVRQAVENGTAAGFEFTREEARVWLDEKLAKEAKGELMDEELETVAGGKGGPQPLLPNYRGLGGIAGLTTVAP